MTDKGSRKNKNKKFLFFNGPATLGIFFLGLNKKNFLVARTSPPHHLIVAGPLRKEQFFCGYPKPIRHSTYLTKFNIQLAISYICI